MLVDALDDLAERGACEERLHAEEVRVEDWGEEELVDDDLVEA